jgi:hypothetical protein
MATGFGIPAAMHQEEQRGRGMARELSQDTSAGAKDAQPHDADDLIRAAPDNPFSGPVNFHSSGYLTTKKGVTFHTSPTKKEGKDL